MILSGQVRCVKRWGLLEAWICGLGPQGTNGRRDDQSTSESDESELRALLQDQSAVEPETHGGLRRHFDGFAASENLRK